MLVDETWKALKDDKLPASVSRGAEAHEKDMLTSVGTLMLNDFLKEQVKRLHSPKRVRPGGHDHDHDHDHDH